MNSLFKYIVWCNMLIFLHLGNTGSVFAQYSKLTGIVHDGATGKPVQYANVSLIYLSDSSFYGAISDSDGRFSIDHLSEGTCKFNVSFVGYRKFNKDTLIINKGKNIFDDIKLDILPENIGQITVTPNSSGIVYHVDRKVIQAQSFPGANVAMDLLENIPSLQLDFEGKLTYRGDGTFIVYINGHPVNNGEEKLRQIAAEDIDYVEVITNPSAKYDAEGTAGIIQVILKRNRLEGYLISTSAQASNIGSYEWLLLLDQKGERGGWYFRSQLENYVRNRNTVTTTQKVFSDNLDNNIHSVVDRKETLENNLLEFGFNYDLTEKDYIDLNMHVNPFKRSQFLVEKGAYDVSQITSGELTDEESYLFDSDFDLQYQYIGGTMSYEHAFTKDRTDMLSAYLTYSAYLSPLSESKTDLSIYEDYDEKKGYAGEEKGETFLKGSISYQNKISEKSSIDMGAEMSLDYLPTVNYTSGYFDNGTIIPFAGEPDDQKVEFKQNVYSGFLTFKSSFGKLEYMLGCRTEYTDRYSNYDYINDNGEWEFVPAKKTFIDFFPSFHSVYNFSEENQLSLSYSRRINRPDYWALIPMKRYESPYLYYTGNGNLNPSYASSFEVKYLYSWEKNFFSAELYGKTNENVLQNYYSRADENKLLWTKENVGNSTSIGTELMADIDILKWWNANLSTSLYWYHLDVDVDMDQHTEEKFRSDSRLNNTFKLSKTFTLRYNLTYRSPSVNAQLDREAYWYSDMSLRKYFDNRKWQVSLSWFNVFNTIKYHTISEGEGFYVDSYFEKDPYVTLKITYRLDNQN